MKKSIRFQSIQTHSLWIALFLAQAVSLGTLGIGFADESVESTAESVAEPSVDYLAVGKTRVFINADEKDLKCGPNFIRYSVWVPGVPQGSKQPLPDEVVLLLHHEKAEGKGFFESQFVSVKNLTPVFRIHESARYTAQQSFCLPFSPESLIKDAQVHVLVLRNQCGDSAEADCANRIIESEGSFSGAAAQKLKPILPTALSRLK